MCGQTLYNVDEKRGEANPVMIPVSSTAIPLDDLPVFKVVMNSVLLTETIFNFKSINLYKFRQCKLTHFI